MTEAEERFDETEGPIPVGDAEESPEEPDQFEGLTDEEVEQRRRAAAAEIERRQKVEAGQERVGQAAHDYLIAARIDCEHTPTELGQVIIDHITPQPTPGSALVHVPEPRPGEEPEHTEVI